ncbi:hypothetical protein [Flammeovirga sp. OC4]|uniref:hypothetical protein n=1 Tax=Flammeovirga sp. OC4 TaxID=1382345 RepID=UPI0005C47A24|nr:hypothetical protein [Flammeovirga sp. OC4]
MNIDYENNIKYCKELGQKGILLQKKNGSMPEGINGPHRHIMTPIRNTAHWSILFAFLYNLTKDESYKVASYKCYGYMFEKEHKPIVGNFISRSDERRNKYNGLVGPAWIIESLYYSIKYYSDPIILKHLTEYIDLFSFDEEKGLWYNLNEYGENDGFELTFNQQVWFTSVVAMSNTFINSEKIAERVNIFFNKLDERSFLKNNGLARLIVKQDFLRNLKYSLINIRKKSVKSKEVPYHIFTLVALAEFYIINPNHSFFKTKKFKKMIALLEKEDFIKKNLNNNEFSYGYNLSGFELAFVSKTFRLRVNDDFIKNECSFQMSEDFNIVDKETFLARNYELIRLIR